VSAPYPGAAAGSTIRRTGHDSRRLHHSTRPRLAYRASRRLADASHTHLSSSTASPNQTERCASLPCVVARRYRSIVRHGARRSLSPRADGLRMVMGGYPARWICQNHPVARSATATNHRGCSATRG
jgi:hypothetical protein